MSEEYELRLELNKAKRLLGQVIGKAYPTGLHGLEKDYVKVDVYLLNQIRNFLEE